MRVYQQVLLYPVCLMNFEIRILTKWDFSKSLGEIQCKRRLNRDESGGQYLPHFGPDELSHLAGVHSGFEKGITFYRAVIVEFTGFSQT